MILHATRANPVTVYYCKANVKTGLTVRVVRPGAIFDCKGVQLSSSLDNGPFDAEMIHGNTTGKPKASGARCALIIHNGTVTLL